MNLPLNAAMRGEIPEPSEYTTKAPLQSKFYSCAFKQQELTYSNIATYCPTIGRGDRKSKAMTTTYSSGKKGDDADLSGVKTLQKALAILDAFAAAERPLTIAEVAVRAGVTRPTAYRLIQTLVAAGYLAQEAGDARIAPGYSVLRLAANL